MSTYRISPAPVIVGTLLWGAATALLLEDAIHSGRYDVATMATPILTAATVAAACLCHARLRDWRILGAVGFLLLALLGSAVMVSGTLGRLAEVKDGKEAIVQAVNRTYGAKDAELEAAKASAKVECKVQGDRCKYWLARVDGLTAELSTIVVRSSDPKADAIARLVTLVGGNGDRAKAIVAAIDPVTLPLFLELGSVLFFGAALPHRRKASTVSGKSEERVETVSHVYTRDEALTDFLRLKAVGGQKLLAARWNVSEGCVSKWMATWSASGQVSRSRHGRFKPARALLNPA